MTSESRNFGVDAKKVEQAVTKEGGIVGQENEIMFRTSIIS